MDSHRALENLVVLDLTRVVAGPYCTMLMGDLGATVIKIENPSGGDDTRSYAPYRNGSSMYFANINRNKKSITLNLKSPEGKEIFKSLVKKADIVVENYRPGVMEKLGLGYEELKKLNEKIIYGSVTGFGVKGPYSKRPGYDILSQAMGGLMSITGQPGDPPTRAGNAMGDVLGGLNLTVGILCALHERIRTGKGKRVDIALLDCVIASLDSATQRYFSDGKVPERIGNRYAPCAPYDVYCAKDGKIVIACGNQHLFELLCQKVMKRQELLWDDRFRIMEERVKNQEELKAIIEEWLKDYGVLEMVDILLENGIPAGPINDLKDITEDEHIVKYRKMFVEVEHPEIGKMKVNGCAVKFLDDEASSFEPAPLLGENNKEILSGFLGIDEYILDEYKEKGII